MQHQPLLNFQTEEKKHFFRLFPDLPPLEMDDDQIWSLAMAMVEFDGERNDSRYFSNGLCIFGQFLAHDITFESTSHLISNASIPLLQNDRTINLDLDCLYGQTTQTFYYDNKKPQYLLLGKEFGNEEVKWYDLQRNIQDIAIIPDARNDENLIVSRLQVLFIQFHNKIVDYFHGKVPENELFEEARKQVTWYYHWLVLHEYLYKIMDKEVFNDLLNKGCRFFTSPHQLPLEFTGAAFRVGHSQSRERNRINAYTERELFDLGFFAEMKDYVDWRYIFNSYDGKCQFAKLIDTKIAKIFHDLPIVKSNNQRVRSLPFRNLKRGVVYGLPSGEDVAKKLGFEAIDVEESKQLKLNGTPLWFYILREAEILGNGGENLGPVGSTLLGECFFTILKHDESSYFNSQPNWTPMLAKRDGSFDFADMIKFVESKA